MPLSFPLKVTHVEAEKEQLDTGFFLAEAALEEVLSSWLEEVISCLHESVIPDQT